MSIVMKKIHDTGIIPVVVLQNAEDARPLGEALCEGGLPCAEVTFRTAAAAESIRILSSEFPNMLVGAGTVLSKEQVDQAVEAGASFIVTPGFSKELTQYCLDKEIPIIPGCSSPSDVQQAVALGLDTVKFFPAEQAGGLSYIKAMAAPFVNVKFMPTGGVNPENVKKYLEYDRIVACGGSWMVKGDLISGGNFDKIKEMTKEAANIVKEIRG